MAGFAHFPEEVMLMGVRWSVGVSAEHAPCRRAHGGTRRGGGSRHHQV